MSRRKEKGLPYMPWYPGDFLAATRGWSITATGVYRALLDAQWELGFLPESIENQRKIIGATKKEWNEGWKKCESKFPIVDGGRQNERLELHRRKAFEISAKRSESGKQGGLASAKANGAASAEPIGVANGATSAVANGAANVHHPIQSNPDLRIKPPAELALDLQPRRTETKIPDEPDNDAGDPDDYLIWTAGLNLIGPTHRSLMGKLVKEHGRELVARKLGELMAMTEKPRDPAAYFVGAMRKLRRGVQV